MALVGHRTNRVYYVWCWNHCETCSSGHHDPRGAMQSRSLTQRSSLTSLRSSPKQMNTALIEARRPFRKPQEYAATPMNARGESGNRRLGQCKDG